MSAGPCSRSANKTFCLALILAFCNISTVADLSVGTLSSVGNAHMKHRGELDGASRYDAEIPFECNDSKRLWMKHSDFDRKSLSSWRSWQVSEKGDHIGTEQCRRTEHPDLLASLAKSSTASVMVLSSLSSSCCFTRAWMDMIIERPVRAVQVHQGHAERAGWVARNLRCHYAITVRVPARCMRWRQRLLFRISEKPMVSPAASDKHPNAGVTDNFPSLSRWEPITPAGDPSRDMTPFMPMTRSVPLSGLLTWLRRILTSSPTLPYIL